MNTISPRDASDLRDLEYALPAAAWNALMLLHSTSNEISSCSSNGSYGSSSVSYSSSSSSRSVSSLHGSSCNTNSDSCNRNNHSSNSSHSGSSSNSRSVSSDHGTSSGSNSNCDSSNHSSRSGDASNSDTIDACTANSVIGECVETAAGIFMSQADSTPFAGETALFADAQPVTPDQGPSGFTTAAWKSVVKLIDYLLPGHGARNSYARD
jgi:hypothetical protein